MRNYVFYISIDEKSQQTALLLRVIVLSMSAPLRIAKIAQKDPSSLTPSEVHR